MLSFFYTQILQFRHNLILSPQLLVSNILKFTIISTVAKFRVFVYKCMVYSVSWCACVCVCVCVRACMRMRAHANECQRDGHAQHTMKYRTIQHTCLHFKVYSANPLMAVSLEARSYGYIMGILYIKSHLFHISFFSHQHIFNAIHA